MINSNVLNQNTINAFVMRENVILKVAKDAEGRQYLQVKNKNLWTWLARCIFRFDSYQLSTVKTYIESHASVLLKDVQPNTQALFVNKINTKLAKSHRSLLKADFLDEIRNVASSVLADPPRSTLSSPASTVEQTGNIEASYSHPPEPSADHTVIDTLLGTPGSYDRLPELKGWFPSFNKYPDDCPFSLITSPLMRMKQVSGLGKATEYLIFKFKVRTDPLSVREGAHVLFWQAGDKNIHYNCMIHGGAYFPLGADLFKNEKLRHFFEGKELNFNSTVFPGTYTLDQ